MCSPHALWIALLLLPTPAAVAANGELLTDPTRPPRISSSAAGDSSAEAKRGEYNLSAVLFSKGRRIAVVNDTRVRIGDQIGDARVLEIEPTAVRLQLADSTFVLSLFKAAPGARPARVEEREEAGEDR